MSIERALLVGGCGGFGRAFSHRLKQINVATVTLDQVEGADICTNFQDDGTHLLEAAQAADLIWLCLPEPSTLAALSILNGKLRADQLLVDICSVKSNVCAAATEHCREAQYVSLHPMFAPDKTFAGQNAVVIPIRQGLQQQAFEDILRAWDLQLISTDAQTHDATTALVQVLAHATLITFAEAQSQMQIDPELVKAMATPTYQSLETTAQGMLAENPSLYHNIQTANPFGEEARLALRQAVATVASALGQTDNKEVHTLFEKLRR